MKERDHFANPEEFEWTDAKTLAEVLVAKHYVAFYYFPPTRENSEPRRVSKQYASTLHRVSDEVTAITLELATALIEASSYRRVSTEVGNPYRIFFLEEFSDDIYRVGPDFDIYSLKAYLNHVFLGEQSACQALVREWSALKALKDLMDPTLDEQFYLFSMEGFDGKKDILLGDLLASMNNYFDSVEHVHFWAQYVILPYRDHPVVRMRICCSESILKDPDPHFSFDDLCKIHLYYIIVGFEDAGNDDLLLVPLLVDHDNKTAHIHIIEFICDSKSPISFVPFEMIER